MISMVQNMGKQGFSIFFEGNKYGYGNSSKNQYCVLVQLPQTPHPTPNPHDFGNLDPR